MIDKKEMLKIFVDANMTQKKLAKLLGKSPTTINKWLNNKSFQIGRASCRERV